MLSKCFFYVSRQLYLSALAIATLQSCISEKSFAIWRSFFIQSQSKKNNDWSKPVSKNLSFPCCLNLSPMCWSIIFSENISIDVKQTKSFLLLQQQKTQHFPSWW